MHINKFTFFQSNWVPFNLGILFIEVGVKDPCNGVLSFKFFRRDLIRPGFLYSLLVSTDPCPGFGKRLFVEIFLIIGTKEVKPVENPDRCISCLAFVQLNKPRD